MRVCVLADTSGCRDEGMKNIGYHLARELAKRHEVLYTSVLSPVRDLFSDVISSFEPTVVHFIPGATIRSFTLLKLFKAVRCSALTVLSVLVPRFHYLPTRLLNLLSPDGLIVQSPAMLKLFEDVAIPCRFIPNGVDVDRFIPRDNIQKISLRKKYGLETDRYISLHVGHIKSGRNIRELKRLTGPERRVIVVGTTTTEPDVNLTKEIRNDGVIVLRSYFDHIEELYGLADCYIFPTLDERYCTGIPLSVLEAMSCNLPIVTTKFGGLELLFNEGDGLFFVNNLQQLEEKVEYAEKLGHVATRQKVIKYKWSEIAQEVEVFYRELLSKK